MDVAISCCSSQGPQNLQAAGVFIRSSSAACSIADTPNEISTAVTGRSQALSCGHGVTTCDTTQIGDQPASNRNCPCSSCNNTRARARARPISKDYDALVFACSRNDIDVNQRLGYAMQAKVQEVASSPCASSSLLIAKLSQQSQPNT